MKPRRLLQAFRFGTELLGKLPTASDGILGTIVKLLAIADAAEKTIGRKTTIHQDIFDRYDLRSRTSEAFTRLFFETKLAKRFTIRRHGASDHLELIEALAEDGERLFFQEYRWGRPEIAAEFFHTPGFNFAGALSALWGQYPDGIYLSFRPARGSVETTFCAVDTAPALCLTSQGAGRLAEAVAAHRARAPRPWTLLAFGPPGTGKTQFALALGKELGGRTLKIDATGLQHLGASEADFLLDALAPTFRVLDDVDRAPVEETRARLLYLFEHLKARGVSVVLTANKPEALDPALLRSGRIDEAKEFPLPGEKERLELIERMLWALVPGFCERDPKAVADGAAEIVPRTEGYNHADLSALVERLQYEEPGQALEAMGALRTLAAAAEAASAGGTGPTAKAPE